MLTNLLFIASSDYTLNLSFYDGKYAYLSNSHSTNLEDILMTFLVCLKKILLRQYIAQIKA